MSLDKVWNTSLQFMNIVGNIVLLQVFNVLLLLTGYLAIVIPIIIIVNTLVIYDYIYDNENFNMLNIGALLKTNVKPIIIYITISFFLMTAIGLNQTMQTIVMGQNLGFVPELTLLIFSMVIGISTITFMMFYPLVACTSDQDILTKLKVTFIIPFFSLKAYILILIVTIVNGIFFFSNALFLILFGPVLLIAVNLIIFHTYIIKKEER